MYLKYEHNITFVYVLFGRPHRSSSHPGTFHPRSPFPKELTNLSISEANDKRSTLAPGTLISKIIFKLEIISNNQST